MIDGGSTGVAEEVEIFSSIVSKFLCQILLTNFSFSSRFENLVKVIFCSTFMALVIGFKIFIPLLLPSRLS